MARRCSATASAWLEIASADPGPGLSDARRTVAGMSVSERAKTAELAHRIIKTARCWSSARHEVRRGHRQRSRCCTQGQILRKARWTGEERSKVMRSLPDTTPGSAFMLAISDLHVAYGQSEVLHGLNVRGGTQRGSSRSWAATAWAKTTLMKSLMASCPPKAVSVDYGRRRA